MPIYELGDGNYVNLPASELKEGQPVARHPCPACEEGTLIVQAQESRYGPELYLECNSDDCGQCYYPQQ